MSGNDLISVLNADAASKGAPAGIAIEKRLKLPNVNYTYIKAEVIEYISNPAKYLKLNRRDPETGEVRPVKELLYNSSNEEAERKILNNSLLTPHMPANSIFASLNSNDPEANVIAYPFFPSHFVMPLKVGERVWLMVEEKGQNIQNFYWMCRVTGDRQTEDLNFTNVDNADAVRQLYDASNGATATVTDENLITPAVTPERFSKLNNFGSTSAIQISSYSFREEHTMEPVPRTHGKSPDFILQGSNNSTIQMTTEKFRPKSDLSNSDFLGPEGNPEDGSVHTPLAGTIDIFVGKEKLRLDSLKGISDPSSSSAPGEFNVKLGTRLPGAQKFETYAASKIDEYVLGEENSNEGNDSPRNVHSRLYMSMNASADSSFEFFNEDFEGNDEFDNPRAPIGSAAVLYSDNIRSYAENSLRLHVYPPTEDIPGNNKNNPGGALLDITNDGTITLQTGQGAKAAKIILKSDGNIIIRPGEDGVLHLGGEIGDPASVAVGVQNFAPEPHKTGETIPNDPPATTTFGGTAFLGDPLSGYTSSNVLIKI